MNPYHDREDRQAPPSDAAHRVVELAKEGKLTNANFESYQKATGRSGSWGHRDYFTANCSWAVYTAQWLASMRRLLAGQRVLEICAGRGILRTLMDGKDGISWICTDAEPPKGSAHIHKADALDAAQMMQADVIFASWIPYESELDYEIARLGFPMVIVGEGHGGCTGSRKFWPSSYEPDDDGVDRPYETHRVPDWFRDLPAWYGVHDHTTLVIPKMTKPEDCFNLG